MGTTTTKLISWHAFLYCCVHLFQLVIIFWGNWAVFYFYLVLTTGAFKSICTVLYVLISNYKYFKQYGITRTSNSLYKSELWGNILNVFTDKKSYMISERQRWIISQTSSYVANKIWEQLKHFWVIPVLEKTKHIWGSIPMGNQFQIDTTVFHNIFSK